MTRPERIVKTGDVFGISRELPENYVERPGIDEKFVDSLSRKQHIVIYGSSKQGKTSLRKHCLREDDTIVVSCQNNMDLRALHAAILKQVGYQVQESTTRTSDGKHKLELSFGGKIGNALLGEVSGGAKYGHDGGGQETTLRKHLQLDPGDPNDIIAALNEISFSKFILLEDFHYLPIETQTDFSFALKAFHENSGFTFIIVAVWREENRLILLNGDLTGRVIAVDADAWKPAELMEVIEAGEALLNVQFPTAFKNELIESALESVYIVQEACRRACTEARIFETCADQTQIEPSRTAAEYVAAIVNEQGGRYKAFLANTAMGFQETELEMYRWILYPVLTASSEDLTRGLTYRTIRERIQAKHPRGQKLNAGNITQALGSISGLQAKKNIKPFVLDYDSTNLLLSVVDKGFLVWLRNQDTNDLLEHLDLSSANDGPSDAQVEQEKAS